MKSCAAVLHRTTMKLDKQEEAGKYPPANDKAAANIDPERCAVPGFCRTMLRPWVGCLRCPSRPFLGNFAFPPAYAPSCEECRLVYGLVAPTHKTFTDSGLRTGATLTHVNPVFSQTPVLLDRRAKTQ